jgi:hypothetical protein
MSLPELDSYDGDDFFHQLFDVRPSKIIIIILSIFGIFTIIPAMYSFIWYERFGSDLHRTLINRFQFIFLGHCWKKA